MIRTRIKSVEGYLYKELVWLNSSEYTTNNQATALASDILVDISWLDAVVWGESGGFLSYPVATSLRKSLTRTKVKRIKEDQWTNNT